MKKRLGSKKFKDVSPAGKKRELSTSESRKRYEDERPHLKEVSQRATAFSESITDSVSLGRRFSGSLLEWGGTTDSPLATTLALVASFQTALGDLQVKISDVLEEKLNGPLRDMLLLERELLNASKKDEVFRSEEMKVETFRMSLVEKFCEYMDSYSDYFKRGALLLNNYQEEVSKTKSASRRQVEEILNSTLEVDAEVAAELTAQLPPPPIFGTGLTETLRLDHTDIPRIVLHIIAYLDHTALTQMGIFRISGHSGSVQALKEAIDSGHEVDLTLLNNAHVAATLFKLYLRTLPDTLTLQARFDEWIHVVNDCDLTSFSPRSPAASPPSQTTPPGLLTPLKLTSSTSSSTLPQFQENVIVALTTLVESLPAHNAHTLDYLIAFCTRVVAHSDQNMMGAKNLASLIAPNILSRAADAGIVNPQVMLEDVSKANKVVECMILNYETIFSNIDYPLKSQPILSLASLAAEYPLCADRSVKHGASMIVDLPPEEAPTTESGTGSPKTEELRKRAAKKKTVSSLSLIKDRKLKKKEKPQSDRQTILVGESDFKVLPTNTSSLRPLSPRSMNDHSRTASEVVSSSSMGESPSFHNIGASSLSDHDGVLRTSSSPPSSISEDEWRPSLTSSARSHGSTSADATNQQKPLSPATSSTDVPGSNGKEAGTGKSQLSSSAKDSKEAKEARKRDRKSSKPRRPSEVGSKRSTSNAPATTSASATSLAASSSSRSGAAGDTSDSIPVYDSATEAPHPMPPVTPTRVRRHSIGLASGEGLDPTKENFGSIGPAGALGLIQSPVASNLNVDALVDDQSGSMRMRANSRRGSVLANPYSPMPRSGSVSQRERLLTPTKLRYPSPISSSANTSTNSAALGGGTASFELLRGISASPPPFSPVHKDKEGKKSPKDRTSALTTVKFENPEDFNKMMDEHFGKGPTTSYVVLGYSATGSIRMLAGGEGGVDEMVGQLKEEEIQYCLIRITYYEDGHPLTRDVFVQWNGPKVSAIQKGIKKAHCGEVKSVLCPTAIEILASSKKNFTLETLLARSAPTAARVID